MNEKHVEAEVVAITFPACLRVTVSRFDIGSLGAAVRYCAHVSQITKMSSAPIAKIMNIDSMHSVPKYSSPAMYR